MSNTELAKVLHKPIIKKIQEKKALHFYIDSIWSAYLADMQLIRTFSKGFRFLLCFIDVFSKYA